MRVTPPEKRRVLRRSISAWYRRNGRHFMWRSTSDPYTILVSEIMLQQTQVSRVTLLLPRFLKLFPTMHALARARRPTVIRAWQGLGYNSRAVRLHGLAKIVVRERAGRLPEDPTHLRSLPGIGPYTANAVSCFAFGKRVEVVDVNVARVLSRIYRRSPAALPAEIVRLAKDILPLDAYEWNQALMDLGSTICTARRPRCTECPVRGACASASAVHAGPASRRRSEPGYAGIPRRLWRGKIVEALRRSPSRRALSLHNIGRIIKPGFDADELPWLRSVAEGLARDGVVELRHPHYIRLAS